MIKAKGTCVRTQTALSRLGPLGVKYWQRLVNCCIVSESCRCPALSLSCLSSVWELRKVTDAPQSHDSDLTHPHIQRAHVKAQWPTCSSFHVRQPKLKLSVSGVGKIPCVCTCVCRSVAGAARDTGRNRPPALWTWSWKESCLPFLSNKLNCYASEHQSAQTGLVKSVSHSRIHCSFYYTLGWNNFSDRYYQRWFMVKPRWYLKIIHFFLQNSQQSWWRLFYYYSLLWLWGGSVRFTLYLSVCIR